MTNMSQQQACASGNDSVVSQAPQVDEVPHMLKAVIEGIQTGVLLTNDRQVIYSNPEMGRLLGYLPNETLAGKMINDLVADGDHSLALQRRKAVAAGRRLPVGWIKLKTKDGELVQMMPKLSCVVLNGQCHFITAFHRACDYDLLEIQARRARAGYQRLLVAELEKQQSAIARELHDALGSELAGISLMVGGLKALVRDDALLSTRLDKVLELMGAAIEMTRGMARSLMPVDTYAGGFGHAMERLASDWTVLKGVPCLFTIEGQFEHVPAQTGGHLYRVAQEAIVNALRHGRATQIQLRLTDDGSDLMLEIEDNGCGFGEGVVHMGMGLRSMMARAETIGGRLDFVPIQPNGSCIKVTWPAGRKVPASGH